MNPRPPECKSPNSSMFRVLPEDFDKLLEEYREFLTIDLRRSKNTVPEKVRYMRRFLSNLQQNTVSRDHLRKYLSILKGEATYRNCLASFKVFFRDFLEMPELVKSFRFPASQFKPKVIPSKVELKKFFEAIDNEIGKALFLFFATTGLRKNEVLSLTRADIDFSNRLVTPKAHSGMTKRCYLSFFNRETEHFLE